MQEQNQAQQNYSLDADMATGWKPKMKIIGPMPLNFDNPNLDTLIKPLIHSDTSIHEVVYIGLRPRDTFAMHTHFAKNYKYKFRHLLTTDYSHLKPFFRKFYSEFEPECKLPFHGMNPKINSNVQFEGRFESGNLDYVVRVKSNEFDLFMRIDSNTNGHIMWYYFKVTNSLNKQRTIRLNICNLRRSKTFYDKCLQPYIYRHGRGWKQEANNLSVTQEKIRFYKEHFLFSNQEFKEPENYRRLSFDLNLQPSEEVEIAYCIPYTYSQLLQDIRDLKIASKEIKDLQFEIDTTNISLSGLQIPYIKIYTKTQQKNDIAPVSVKKQNILIIGRQHPGESNGSHVLKGFMEQLIRSKDRKICEMREQINFHIIPMLNPDGVVMGNFRTSLYGKDLNRLFRKNQTFMIPEIEFCKNLVFEITKNKKKKIFMFMDFHGHSVKRNAFCFAPSTFETNSIEDVRQFPRIISEVTEMFRYPSCSFRISNHKKATARAVFCNDAHLFYTIQTSNWSYYSKTGRVNILFQQQSLLQLGGCLLASLGLFYEKVSQRKNSRKRKAIQQKNETSRMMQHNSSSLFKLKVPQKIYLKTHENILDERDRSINFIKRTQGPNMSSQHVLLPGSTRIIRKDSQILAKNPSISIRKDKKIINSSTDRRIPILEDSAQHKKQQLKEIEQSKQKNQGNESEGEAGSDDSDESQKQDMEKQKFKKYINGATRMFIQFQKAYYGEEYEEKGRYQLPKKVTKRKQKDIAIVLQACLKGRSKSDRNTIESDKNINKIGSNQQRQQRVKFVKIDDMTKKPGIIPLSELQVPSKEQTLKSLPKINIVNYLPYEDIELNMEKKIFKIPKIESLHMKNLRKF